MNTIIIAACDRGLTFEGLKEMEIGQIVDYCIQWNDVHDPDEKKKTKPTKRKATQADWDAFLG